MLGSDDFWVPLKYFNYLTYKAHKSMPFGFEMCKKGLILLSYQVKFQNVTQNRLHLFLFDVAILLRHTVEEVSYEPF